MSKLRRMWIGVLGLLLLAAHFSLCALVPLQIGDPSPPWWVGGRLIWPFAVATDTLVSGAALDTATPLLAISSTLSLLLAAAALLRWRVPERWFTWLIVGGVGLSIMLQVIWFTGWAILPLLVDLALLWMVLPMQVRVANLRVLPA